MNKNKIKIGRFAPSPTGSLHFGSLIAAVASYLCARKHDESQWLLRIEDVDTQRKQKVAATSIIKTLEAYGFMWDGEITYQSLRTNYYQEALDQLSEFTYPCSCTRKELQALSNDTTYGYIYPGRCRQEMQNEDVKNPSIRITTNNDEVCFKDQCQPNILCQNIENDVGDFILKRRDGLFAYQLAVVVDDHLQHINHVVRGSDLLDNTPRQIYLQQLLNYQTPEYLHFPIATTVDGKKLSKQNLSPEISLDLKREQLIQTLIFLGQTPPSSDNFSSIDDLWQWAIQHWNDIKIPRVMSIVKETDLHNS